MNIKVNAQGAFNLLIRRYAGPFWYRRHWLSKTQRLSAEAMECLQLKLLKGLVRHAERYVPYYREMMKRQGFSSADIHSLEDIKKFPVLTKSEVVEAGDAMLSRHYCKRLLRHAFTGGTTGLPLNLYRSLFSIGNEHAFVRRQWDWAGIGFRDICAFAKGRIIDNPDGYVYDPIMKELHFSTYNMTLESAKRYVRLLKDYPCKALVGYPSSIFLLAQAKADMAVELPIKSILLTSETLTESAKGYIAEVFDVPVYDFYGAAERVCYIFTCPKGHYHIQPEYGLTELLPSDTGGFKVVATGFWNQAMPLIRYDTGDKVMLSDKTCSCGRAFPVVDQISGREGDFIRTPAGKIFGVSILTHIFHVVCGIDTFVESQIVQRQLNHLVVRYIPSRTFQSGQIPEYIEKLKDHLGSEINIEFVSVDAIEKTTSGKHKFVVSEIEDC